jgi:hypothetical protein
LGQLTACAVRDEKIGAACVQNDQKLLRRRAYGDVSEILEVIVVGDRLRNRSFMLSSQLLKMMFV